MSYPKVSVVTITYGHEKYITKTLDGVLMQQYDGSIEFIIANDNSPDGTDVVVKNYFKENPIPANFEIRYTKHETNKSMMPNFNWALQQATGKYIALCEGDDYWTDPLKLHKQVEFLEKNEEFGLVHTNYKYYYSKNSEYKVHMPQARYDRISENDYYVNTGDMRTCTVVFRSRFLAEISKLMSQSFMQAAVIGDRPLFLLVSKLSKIYFLKDITSVYHITELNSASHFDTVSKYYNYLQKVFILNVELLNYLKIDNETYMKSQQRKINFYDILISYQNKEYFTSFTKCISKTILYFWNKEEIVEVYANIKHT